MQMPGQAGGFQGGHSYGDSRVCRELSQTGRCKWGSNCRFSHDIRPSGQQEFGAPTQQQQQQQQRQHAGHADKMQAALYKTKLCPQFLRTGQCSYGSSCKFAHGQQERHDFTGFEGVSQAPAAAQQQQHPQLQHHHHQQQQQHGHEQQQPHHFQHQQQQNQYMQQLQHEPQLPTSGQLQQQQQQQRVSGGHPMSRPGTVTYVDRLRAMCKALGIGNAGDHVSDEAMAAAVLAVQRGTAFKENRFADSVERYLPIT